MSGIRLGPKAIGHSGINQSVTRQGGFGTMKINLRAVQLGAVGEVTGTDIYQSITPDEAAARERGMNDYAVLAFPNQAFISGKFRRIWRSHCVARMAKPEKHRSRSWNLATSPVSRADDALDR
jgi:hypothetical protein